MIRVDCRRCTNCANERFVNYIHKERQEPKKNREGGRNHGIDRKR